ncbi:MAG: GNAT family N-acetyltransferase [Chloroflexota bacterium]
MHSIWQGKRVRLRALELDDWRFFFSWNDTETGRMVHYVEFPQSAASAEEWVKKEANKSPQNDQMHLMIETLDGHRVGIINPHTTDRRTGTFSYGIAVHPDYRGRGYASEAICLLMRYFFDELRYQKCTIDLYSYNVASIALHERLGFTQEGRLRRMIFTNGQFFDQLFYGMTIEEYRVKLPDFKQVGFEPAG